jgi:hypothetical protein
MRKYLVTACLTTEVQKYVFAETELDAIDEAERDNTGWETYMENPPDDFGVERSEPLYPRQCANCGKGMDEGYSFGDNALCSDECAFNDDFTKADFEKNYRDGGDCHWTTWEGGGEDTYYTLGGEEVTALSEDEPLKGENK